MIYCVRYADVAAHLESVGFRLIGETEEASVFTRPDRAFVLRLPNVNGHVPESVLNDAFDAAGLDPPAWDVFWCD